MAMNENEENTVSDTSELAALRERVASIENRERERSARLRRRALFVVLAAAFGSVGALAASGNCPNGMPYCFTAGTPALSSQVNYNFAQLKEWLENKTGPVDGGTTLGDVTVAGAVSTTGNVNVGGDVHVDGGLTVGRNATIAGTLTAGTLTTTTPVAGTVLGGFSWNCNQSSSVLRGCTAWGAATCGGGCLVGTCSAGTSRIVTQGSCYNTTDNFNGYCYASLCIQ
jgi:hypothetical protein